MRDLFLSFSLKGRCCEPRARNQCQNVSAIFMLNVISMETPQLNLMWIFRDFFFLFFLFCTTVESRLGLMGEKTQDFRCLHWLRKYLTQIIFLPVILTTPITPVKIMAKWTNHTEIPLKWKDQPGPAFPKKIWIFWPYFYRIIWISRLCSYGAQGNRRAQHLLEEFLFFQFFAARIKIPAGIARMLQAAKA